MSPNTEAVSHLDGCTRFRTENRSKSFIPKALMPGAHSYEFLLLISKSIANRFKLVEHTPFFTKDFFIRNKKYHFIYFVDIIWLHRNIAESDQGFDIVQWIKTI